MDLFGWAGWRGSDGVRYGVRGVQPVDTLYEFGSDRAVSERKKRILQSVAKRRSLHGAALDCFRLNPRWSGFVLVDGGGGI